MIIVSAKYTLIYVFFRRWLVLFLSVLLIGCQTPPLRTISQQELEARYPDFVSSYKTDLDNFSERAYQRIKSEYIQSLESQAREPQSYDLLILSGGGAFGAFGVGFLEGWGSVKSKALSRPRFDSVSGISTGAMIAPFIFIDTPEAYREIVDIYSNPESDWVRKRGLVPYLPGNVSLFDVAKLHERIRSTVNPSIVEELAKESSDGRQLLVGATNVDYGLMRVWDIAGIARDESKEKAMNDITQLVLASSAIPGAFPPILIDDMLYVDGGASMQIVSGIDDRAWAYAGNTEPFPFVKEGRPARIRVWVVVNQKLLSDPSVVRSRWTSIAQRSLSTLVRTSTLQAIQDMETYIRLINTFPEIDAQMRYVAIPQDFSIPNSDEMFDAQTMRRLMALGREMGADSASWRSDALKPGAPFIN